VRVTFRYEGETRSVRVRGAVEALGDTDLARGADGAWTLELEVPDDVRTVYWFALDGADDWTEWLPDPANPSRYVYPEGLEFTAGGEVVGSLLEGPDARPLAWSLEQDVPRGDVRVELVDGRRVWFYDPPREAEGRLLLFDGEAYTTLAPAPVVLDNLIAAGRIPPLAAVLPAAVDTDTRMRDLNCNAEFLEWCAALLPDAPPELSVVAGSSMGGRAAVFFGAQRPDLFGNVLAQSGAFFEPFPEVPAGLPLRFYLDVGVLEDRLLSLVRSTRDDLAAKGYDVAYAEFAGGHDFFWWRETLADGLVALTS
jgi:enterochelin esterase-like enzyme